MNKQHVRHSLHIKKESWCGKPLEEFEKHLQDIEHLLTYSRHGGDNSLICKECRYIIFDAIRETIC